MSRHFISYSSADSEEFALRLRDGLEGGHPSFPVWLSKHDIRPGRNWDEEVAEALETCLSFLFVMTRDSVENKSVCKREWTYALEHKKPIIPIKLHADVKMPFLLGQRHYIDFTRALESEDEFNAALARLRKHLEWRASPAGVLQALEDRLAEAQHDLRHATGTAQAARIKEEIDQLKREVTKQSKVVRDSQAAARLREEDERRHAPVTVKATSVTTDSKVTPASAIMSERPAAPPKRTELVVTVAVISLMIIATIVVLAIWYEVIRNSGRHIPVPADKRWMDAGPVMEHQFLRIKATGSVSLDNENSSPPTGLPFLVDKEKPMLYEPTGALIARIGDDNNQLFAVGEEKVFYAPHEGHLFLGVNEGKLDDNKGSYDVTIEVLHQGPDINLLDR